MSEKTNTTPTQSSTDGAQRPAPQTAAATARTALQQSLDRRW